MNKIIRVLLEKSNIAITLAAALAISLTIGLTSPVAALAASPATINLGTADSFAVLAYSAVNDTTPSVVIGDVGLSPTTGTFIYITAAEVTGKIYAVDAFGPAGSVNDPALLTTAKNDLTTAYNAAANSTPVSTIPTELGGSTILPGVYNSAAGTFGITGTTTLDAQGDPNAVFIFQAASTLTTAASSNVVLINGAQPCNVFWQVGSSATLGTGSNFKGTILASASITDNGGSTVEGRFLASTGAVTLNNTRITKPTCTVPAIPPTPNTGGTSALTNYPPEISITKVPTPLALPAGPGSVTYNYLVSNVGAAAMSNITVTDNKCSPVTYISGDVNGNSMLDGNEIWHYSCTTKLSQTTTDTATAMGHANGLTAVDTANATVIVGAPIIPPLIHVVKTPNVFVLPAGGGAVTYTYAVINPGTVPLSNVSVADNKCSPISGPSGDVNHNNMLDTSETWIYTCRTNLTANTVNLATAEGSANGLTAIDYSPATVIVASPKLPNTGFPPKDEDATSRNIFVLVGLIAVASASLIVAALRKSKI